MTNTNLFGIDGELEALALRWLEAEQDDDGCNVEEEKDFNEDEALDDARQGAGYESEEARF
jgi:hypothetical protein